MSIFGALLLFGFIWFILRPLVRLVWMGHRMRRQMNDLFGAQGRAQNHGSYQSERPGGWSRPTPHRKKINPSDGEYVRFQEISEEESTTIETDGQTTTYTSESQITDAEWEEID